MSIEYARIRNGSITTVRYTDRSLRFGDTLLAVRMTGDMVVPLFSPAPNISESNKPVYRDPTQYELDNEIKKLSDLDTGLYDYDRGVSVASLNPRGNLDLENVPSSVVTYLGLWNPKENEPELVDGIGDTGDRYQVVDGFYSDYEIDLGSGPQMVRTNTQIEYRDGIWKSTGFIRVTDRERYLLDNAMVMNPNVKYDDTYGTEQGAFDIVSYPEILETLNGGTIIGQLEAVNSTNNEILLLDNDGLSGLVFIPETGEIYLNADGVPPRTYNPTFMVSGSWGRSKPIPLRLDVLVYTLEYLSDDIIVESGDVHREPISSPQDPDPELYILNDGGMWDARISADGKNVELDTFCVDEGEYNIDVIATSDKGTSEVLTVPTSVTLAPDQEPPFWQKETVPNTGIDMDSKERIAQPRLDMMSIDALPLDTVL